MAAVGRRVWLPCAVALAIGLTACGPAGSTGASGRFTPARPGTLTVATAFFPAAGFWEGTPAAPTGGFEWALARALAHRFGLNNVAVVSVPFSDLVAGHLHGADLALSELTPTSEREKVLQFTSPYLLAPPAVVVRHGITTPDEAALRRLRWATLRGSTLTSVVTNQVHPDQTPQEYDSRTEALAAIAARDAEAMLLDLPVALALARAHGATFAVTAQLMGSEELSAALPHDSSNFDAVDSAMRAWQADGTLDTLSKRWFGTALSAGDAGLPLIRTES